MKSKHIYVVLGLGRSGTSAITKGLNTLGIALGQNLGKKSSEWNAKGSYEDYDISRLINRKLLKEITYSYELLPTIESVCTNANIDAYKTLAMEVLRARFVDTEHWGFKDPNTSKILPFWRNVFNALDLDENYIIALRNPLAVAHSFKRVINRDLESSLIAWMVYLVSSIEYSQGKKRLIVSYEDLLENPAVQLQRIKHHLNIPELSPIISTEHYCDEFLDKTLRRYEYSLQELKSHPATLNTNLCIRMYDLLLKLAKDEYQFSHVDFIIEWSEIKKSLQQLLPVYSYIDQIVANKMAAEKRLQKLQQTFLWKLLYPLRLLEKPFHGRKRKVKHKKIESLLTT